MRGTTKTRDRMGLPGIGRDPVPGFSIWHYWIPVPIFDVIAITDTICFMPLAINNCDAMVIGSRPVPSDPGSRIPG